MGRKRLEQVTVESGATIKGANDVNDDGALFSELCVVWRAAALHGTKLPPVASDAMYPCFHSMYWWTFDGLQLEVMSFLQWRVKRSPACATSCRWQHGVHINAYALVYKATPFAHVWLYDAVCSFQVARVSQIFVDKKDAAKFSVYWYYFPDDVKRGRQVCPLSCATIGCIILCEARWAELWSRGCLQSYHALDEIFRSDHHQSDPLVSSKTVIWTCAVLSLEKWVAFLASPANPNGPVVVKGPVKPAEFDIETDLAACKDLARRHLLGELGKEGVVAGRSASFSTWPLPQLSVYMLPTHMVTSKWLQMIPG
jgi:hypothetical protein